MHRLLPLLAFLLTPALSAQPLRLEYFTGSDGLSAREINHLHINDDGFLWVSTMDGLNRFDGQTFRRVGARTATGPGLSRAAISRVANDNEGKFIVTFQDFFGYFDRFDPRNFTAEQVRLAPSTGVLGYPRAITTDSLGRTFVVTIGAEGTILYEYTPNEEDETKTFTKIYQDTADVWTYLTPHVELLAHGNGQFLLYDQEHGFRHLSATGELLGRLFEEKANLRRFYAFIEAADGRVYFSFRGGIPLFTWMPGGGYSPVPVVTEDSKLRYPQLYKDERGQLMAPGTEDFLGAGSPVEYLLVDTDGNSTFYEGLPTGREITAMAALDFRQTVYLGIREGLGVVQRYRNPVRVDLQKINLKDNDNRIKGLAEDGAGNIYALEDNGTVFAFSPDGPTLDTLMITRDSVPPDTIPIRAAADLIYDVGRNALWAAGRGLNSSKTGVLIHYDLRNGRTTEYPISNPPTALTMCDDGSVYVGVSDPRRVGILLRLDPETGGVTEVVTKDSTVTKVDGFLINGFTKTAGGELLMSTDRRGVLGFDPLSGVLTDYKIMAGEPEEEGGVAGAIREGEAVFCVHEDGRGNWWLGTDAGLVRYERASGQREVFGRGDGLSSNVVYGILPDSLGGFWLSTQNGITHLPVGREPGSARRYYEVDGLSNDEFLPRAFLRGRGGRYYFGGVKGMTSFRDEDLSTAGAGTDVMLTEVVIYGRTDDRTITDNLDDLYQVTVYAAEKSIAISFALPAGQLPSSSRFRYRLEGFNDEWVYLVNERTIRFNNLPAGSYLLRLQGAGANGNYGERELTLAIKVRQYPFEKVWFQIMVVAMFAGLLLFILQAKLKEKLRNEQLRTQLSADIHDEVSGLLAGITLQAELLKNKTDDEKLKARLHTVGEAGRSAMSKMSDVIWSIDSRRDTIGNLLQRMQEHADEVLLPLDIRYDFKASGFDEAKELPGNIRQDVYFIYKEAINNIARHSNATTVEIEVEQFAQFFELFIRDNGRPATPTGSANSLRTSVRAQKTGQGKDNMRMRAERLKGQLSIDEREGYTLVFRMKRLG